MPAEYRQELQGYQIPVKSENKTEYTIICNKVLQRFETPLVVIRVIQSAMGYSVDSDFECFLPQSWRKRQFRVLPSTSIAEHASEYVNSRIASTAVALNNIGGL